MPWGRARTAVAVRAHAPSLYPTGAATPSQNVFHRGLRLHRSVPRNKYVSVISCRTIIFPIRAGGFNFRAQETARPRSVFDRTFGITRTILLENHRDRFSLPRAIFCPLGATPVDRRFFEIGVFPTPRAVPRTGHMRPWLCTPAVRVCFSMPTAQYDHNR